jgi:hypothetical protein
MSRSRCAGFLEGIDAVAQDALPQQRLHRFAIYYVPCASQEFAEAKFQPRIFKDTNGQFRVEVNQNVNIATSPRLPPCHGSKHRRMANSEPLQFRFGGFLRF